VKIIIHIYIRACEENKNKKTRFVLFSSIRLTTVIIRTEITKKTPAWNTEFVYRTIFETYDVYRFSRNVRISVQMVTPYGLTTLARPISRTEYHFAKLCNVPILLGTYGTIVQKLETRRRPTLLVDDKRVYYSMYPPPPEVGRLRIPNNRSRFIYSNYGLYNK